MSGKISIGQYYPIKSSIHELDPRTKFLSILYFIILLFNLNSSISYLIAILGLGIVVILSKIPFKLILKSLKHIIIIVIITGILNTVFTVGDNVVFQYKFIIVTIEGLQRAGFIIIRLVSLIIASTLLTLTTKPIEITHGIESLLKPFKILKIPSHEIAMIMTISLSFIPTIIEELDKITKAQTSRGGDFETGNILEKAKSLIPILVPLFVSSFRRADDLAMAMEARCYRGDIKRTKMHILKFTILDYKFIASLIVMTLLIIFI